MTEETVRQNAFQAGAEEAILIHGQVNTVVKGPVLHFHSWPVFPRDQHTKADTAVVGAATSQSPSPTWQYLKSHPCSTGVEGMKVLRLRGS